jgi:hypothetical protein
MITIIENIDNKVMYLKDIPVGSTFTGEIGVEQGHEWIEGLFLRYIKGVICLNDVKTLVYDDTLGDYWDKAIVTNMKCVDITIRY